MQRFILGMICLTIGCAEGASEPRTKASKTAISKELETFGGTWEIVTVMPDGATKDARMLVFNEDGTYAAQGKNGKELWTGTFEIDPTAMPKVWDHRSHDAMKEGKDVLGIYDLNGNRLRVACIVGHWNGDEWVGKARPSGFSPDEADVVIEFKRLKSNK